MGASHPAARPRQRLHACRPPILRARC